MRIFVTSLTEGTPDKESVASTAREIIRGGQMLDQLIEERKEMLEALEDKESFQSLIKSLHMLREVSIEIGPITERDNVVLRPEDRIEIQPTFELACRIAKHFGEDGQCAACGPHVVRTVVAADGGPREQDKCCKNCVLRHDCKRQTKD